MEAVYGARLEGINVVEVPADLAPLFADAHRRVLGGRAGMHEGDGVVRDAEGREIAGDPHDDPWVPPADEVLEAVRESKAVVVLAGPGVVFDACVPGLHELAAGASLGVLNTWGAKGVFDWRSRHHLATVGLQALDFDRGGIATADLIIATGIDEREILAGFRLAPVVDVAPRSLAPLADRWGRPRTDIALPPLRSDLARVTQAGWQRSRSPLPPTRVTRHYSDVVAAGGLVAADPGVSGYWVARTLGTTRIGGVQVPSRADAHGFAIACAIVARLRDPSRDVLAVVDAMTDRHEALLEAGRSLGVRVAVEIWSGDGHRLDADAHMARLDSLMATAAIASVATDPRQLEEMIEVAGPVVAWTA